MGALTRFYDLHPNYMKLIGSLSYEDIRNAVPREALESTLQVLRHDFDRTNTAPLPEVRRSRSPRDLN